MSKISIDLIWKLDEGILAPGKYSNKHVIKFTSEKSIIADSAPDWQGDSKNINPEQTLAASLSSCHMMTFLALAAKMGWPVLSYTDNAIATLGKNLEGKMSVTSIELNPKIKFSDKFSINEAKMKEVQERAHRYCFIANSLSSEVKVKIR
tara:strand:+ start:5664 stop:6113 length:450 start_codon:yes stop_codon:yes gene_type:complete